MLFLEVVITDQCPYCDQKLGARTPGLFEGLNTTTEDTLVKLYRKIWPRSIADPKKYNPSGMKLASGDSDSHDLALLRKLCSQHRYEAAILPLSLKLQFPRSVDFEDLVSRMGSESMKEILESLYEAPWLSCALKMVDDQPIPKSYEAKVLAKYLERNEERPYAG